VSFSADIVSKSDPSLIGELRMLWQSTRSGVFRVGPAPAAPAALEATAN
jgi:hypothetical protein